MDKRKIKIQYIGAEKEYKSTCVSLGSLAQMMESGKYAMRVEKLRQSILYLNYNKVYAERVPCLYPSIGKDGYTGIVILTIKADKCDKELLRQRICAMAQTVMCFESVSRKTLKVFVDFTLEDGSLPTTETDVTLFHEHAYFRAVTLYEQTLGCEVVRKQTDVNTGCRYSTDVNVYYNPQSIPKDGYDTHPQMRQSGTRSQE